MTLVKLSLATVLVALSSALCADPLPPVTWKNVDNAHYVGGRRCSAGYLRGKVTLVCRDKARAARMEEVWESFKTKPFVLIGSYDTVPKGVTYPVYKDVGLVEREIEEPLFIIDGTQVVRYRLRDEHRATEAVVTMLTDMEMPKSDMQWRKFLDYEIAALPGRALLRYDDCKKARPVVAQEYAKKLAPLAKIPDIKKHMELVRFARGVKDLRAITADKKPLLKAKIESVMEKCASLKESENPHVAQEAKNALADLAWVKAGL